MSGLVESSESSADQGRLAASCQFTVAELAVVITEIGPGRTPEVSIGMIAANVDAPVKNNSSRKLLMRRVYQNRISLPSNAKTPSSLHCRVHTQRTANAQTRLEAQPARTVRQQDNTPIATFW